MRNFNRYFKYTLLLVVILVAAVLALYHKQNNYQQKNILKEYKQAKTNLELSNVLKKEINNDALVYQINTFKNNTFSGTISLPPEGSGLETTKAIFSYNEDTKELYLKYNDFNSSIDGVVKTGDFIYYIETETNYDTECYKWNLVQNNEDLNSRKVMLTGSYNLMTITPLIKYDEVNDNIYFISTGDTVDKENNLLTQDVAFYRIKGNNIEQLYNFKYDKQDGKYLKSTWSLKIINDNIYYALSSKKDNDFIYSYDVKEKANKPILEVKDKIYDFEILDDYIATVFIGAGDTSELRVYKDNQKIFEQKFTSITNIYKISNREILVESNAKYDIYNTQNNKMQEFKTLEELHKYTIRNYDNGKLILMYNYDDKLLQITQ